MTIIHLNTSGYIRDRETKRCICAIYAFDHIAQVGAINTKPSPHCPEHGDDAMNRFEDLLQIIDEVNAEEGIHSVMGFEIGGGH